jgi:hypothetical protein
MNKINITEDQINTADVKEILKKASDYRSNPRGLGKLFKGLRKEKIELSDLQKSWASEGYPDDTRDLTALLLSHGFSKKEIKKVFTEVFGSEDEDGDGEPDVPQQSATLNKVVQYAKKNNLTQDLIAFMQKEYGFKESIDHGGKLVVEDIREIFTRIVHEERLGRAELIKQEDKLQLGRTKK